MSDGEGRPGILFVFSGPSGVGKDTVIMRLKERGFPIRTAVTATTRKMRAGEVNGKSYFFVSRDEFDQMRDAGELLEWAVVHGNCYGTPRSTLREAIAAGEDALLKIDVQGAAIVKEKVPNAVFIFLAPPSVAELVARLTGRGTESASELQIRLGNAHREMEDLPKYDYVVVNHNERLDETVDKIEAIIMAERCRVKPRRISI
jgi:guanylate kinase